MNPEQSPRPFEELNDTDKAGSYFKLHESEKNPNFVVKVSDIYDFAKKEEAEAIGMEIQNYVNKSKGTDLESYIPRSQVVIGKESGREHNAYVISEKIDGVPAYDLENIQQERENFLNILSAFTDVYLKTFDGERGLTPEFDNIQNYVKGVNRETPDGEKLYYVDFFPIYKDTPKRFVERLKNFVSLYHLHTNISVDDLQSLIEKVNKLKTKAA